MFLKSLRRSRLARDAGLVVHDGDAPVDNAVEQRGFAHVGATDDGDQI